MNGQRKTLQRKLILEAVKELDIHATAEQVYEHIAEKHPTISKATVYRNLSQMAETGELLNIGVYYGSTHYDHNCHKHYHFVCEQCKRVFDVDNVLPEPKVAGMEGFVIKKHSLSFSGLCRECA